VSDAGPGFDARRRIAELEACVEAQAEELSRVRRGFGAMLGILERQLGALEPVRRAADLPAARGTFAPDPLEERVTPAVAAPEPPERRCACGCGADLTGRPPQALYDSGKCRERGRRRRRDAL